MNAIMTNMKLKKSKVLIVLGLLVVIGLVILFSIPFIRFIEDPDKLRDFINSFGIFSKLAYFVLVTIQILIPFIPGEPFEIFAGYAFGGFEGFVIVLLAESFGSIIVILLTRKYGHKFVETFFSKDKIEKLSFLKNKKVFVLFAIIFILPGTPKDLLCYFAGLSKFDLVPLFIVVSLGRIPSIITSTMSAGALALGDYKTTIIITIVTIVLSGISLKFYQYIHNKKNQNINH